MDVSRLAGPAPGRVGTGGHEGGDDATRGPRLENQADGFMGSVISNRRSFLARAVGTAGTFALLALSAGACKSGSGNDCDSDITDSDPRNADAFDPLGDPIGGGGDPCP